MSKKCDPAALSAEELREREFYWAKEYGTRNFGIGVQCDKCGKYRMAFEWSEEKDVPKYVECSMIRIDGQMGSCSIPSHLTDDSDEFSEGQFVPGSVVLAKYCNYPWWPAIITDDVTQPENHFMYERNGRKFYHLEFFDPKRTTRALIDEKYIKPYDGKKYSMKLKSKCKENLEKSLELARKSLKVPEKIRVYWMLKYIKYREKKHPINVNDIPLAMSIDEDLGTEVDSSALTDNGYGNLDAENPQIECEQGSFPSGNSLPMPHPGAEVISAHTQNGFNTREAILQQGTCLVGSTVLKDENQNGENESEKLGSLGIGLIFQSCKRQSQPEDSKCIFQSELYDKNYENSTRMKMYKYCKNNL